MRLEELQEQIGDRVDIEWRSFLLRPQPESRPMEQFTEYTHSWSRPAEMAPSAGFVVPWSGEHGPPSGSLGAAIAGKVAASFGDEAWERFHTGLLTAYFTEHRTISDLDVQVDVARAAGIDAEEFRHRLDDRFDEFRAEVVEEFETAQESGITGIPAVVADGRYLISGAVDTEHYVRVVEHIEAERVAASD